MGIPVVSIVGQHSNSGKTTLLVKLLTEAKRRGWRIAAVKHDVHGFEMDKPGKDTWRFAQAGADVVVISSQEKMAMIEKVEEERTLEEVIARIPQVDLIFTEGYKHGKQPRIEVFRSAVHKELLSKPEQLIAIASDVSIDVGVPCFDLDDAVGICDFLAEKYSL
ncbi:molybdopterin guanine dinucleotide biosynthesis accessory protein MobB [Desulfitobacterium dichloroeliminans LMG P-21439]|uniref:Molybdopterin guanine dinucleotide biosynthesis accessory protein MobB n=1 Tax=Desulfitobacterium dichloroeliminans (strain LMG P-21439 / DCA1) TaxID=871963 RepID=L0FC65_DESDL|nr:molybdopterin-guanine dinucleotide biosynthesis protein B [Desulfitobacterium dichloroeliminans]AGA70246.1 molybdopterin guanine dinucleotide biosynthesis accessory protein MobB [Desulfitobacterium dichloroeliminans LMG P-21439]